MTPDELAALHPKLYHVTTPGSWPQISRHGLLSARAAVALFDPERTVRTAALERRRSTTIALDHPELGHMEINDQLPLSEKALETCLDDGLSPLDWLSILNHRVFFWPSEKQLARLLGARMNKGRDRDVLVFDTLSVAKAHPDLVDLSPINSGATIRRPARRGLATFTPFAELSYNDWRRQRGKTDRIVEVTLRGLLPDPAAHLIRIDHHIG
ncbi:hypothetical protein [uncultured Hoeflea sp.]|uniref:DUF7002 family protein n=1 Tax=uncultured Hoeflea sp. TaxID=538666 RepID=UPI0026255AD6|nr:hypothetical protein [uncultured Hoeflea sp.]